MTLEELQQTFETYEDEYIEFERVLNPLSGRPDLHAFMVLDRLIPGTRDMVSCAEHDTIFLEVSPEALAKVATEDELVDLIRCGVRYDSDTDSFAMFV